MVDTCVVSVTQRNASLDDPALIHIAIHTFTFSVSITASRVTKRQLDVIFSSANTILTLIFRNIQLYTKRNSELSSNFIKT